MSAKKLKRQVAKASSRLREAMLTQDATAAARWLGRLNDLSDAEVTTPKRKGKKFSPRTPEDDEMRAMRRRVKDSNDRAEFAEGLLTEMKHSRLVNWVVYEENIPDRMIPRVAAALRECASEGKMREMARVMLGEDRDRLAELREARGLDRIEGAEPRPPQPNGGSGFQDLRQLLNLEPLHDRDSW